MRSYTVEKRLGRGSKPDVSVLQSLHNGSKYFQSIYGNIISDSKQKYADLWKIIWTIQIHKSVHNKNKDASVQ